MEVFRSPPQWAKELVIHKVPVISLERYRAEALA
jgi:hypothetical protein